MPENTIGVERETSSPPQNLDPQVENQVTEYAFHARQ